MKRLPYYNPRSTGGRDEGGPFGRDGGAKTGNGEVRYQMGSAETERHGYSGGCFGQAQTHHGFDQGKERRIGRVENSEGKVTVSTWFHGTSIRVCDKIGSSVRRAGYVQFDLQNPDFSEFEKTEQDLKNCEAMWTFYEEFHSHLNNLCNEGWIYFRNKLYRLDELLGNWEKRVEEREATAVSIKMLQEINSYKAVIPVLKYVRGELFGEKHWLEMFSLLQMTNKGVETLTLQDFLKVKENLINAEQKLQVIIQQAICLSVK